MFLIRSVCVQILSDQNFISDWISRAIFSNVKLARERWNNTQEFRREDLI